MTTLRAARHAHYIKNDFGLDGGASKRWVIFKLGPVPLAIPNSEARMRAVAYHDLHHVLTGYDTGWRGEFEISAFEIAVGCAHFWVAWLLDLSGMAAGALFSPRRTFAAFVRGRRARGLYQQPSIEPYLDREVGDVRRELMLDQPAERQPGDLFRFILYCEIGMLINLLPVFGLIAIGFVLYL